MTKIMAAGTTRPRGGWRPRRALPAHAKLPPALRDLFRRQDVLDMRMDVFATRSGYSDKHLRNIRYGRVIPSLSALIDMAQTLGCEVRVVPIGTEIDVGSPGQSEQRDE